MPAMRYPLVLTQRAQSLNASALVARYVVPAPRFSTIGAPAGLVLAFEGTSNSRHTTPREARGGKQVQGMDRGTWALQASACSPQCPYPPHLFCKVGRYPRSTLPRSRRLPRAPQQSSWLFLGVPRIHLRRQTVEPSDVAKHFVETQSAASVEIPRCCRRIDGIEQLRAHDKRLDVRDDWSCQAAKSLRCFICPAAGCSRRIRPAGTFVNTTDTHGFEVPHPRDTRAVSGCSVDARQSGFAKGIRSTAGGRIIRCQPHVLFR